MKMFMHHIYEYKKGVRDLILCTMCRTCAELVTERLRRQQIEYLAQDIDGQRVNLYFGKRACLDAVRMFIDKPLNRLQPQAYACRRIKREKQETGITTDYC